MDQGVAYLKSQRGKHFDPTCIDAFLADPTRVEAIRSSLAD